MTTIEALQQIVSAYEELDQAKSDCTDVVESALDTLAAAQSLTADDRKNLKKIARAKADEKLDKVKAETESRVSLLEVA